MAGGGDDGDGVGNISVVRNLRRALDEIPQKLNTIQSVVEIDAIRVRIILTGICVTHTAQQCVGVAWIWVVVSDRLHGSMLSFNGMQQRHGKTVICRYIRFLDFSTEILCK